MVLIRSRLAVFRACSQCTRTGGPGSGLLTTSSNASGSTSPTIRATFPSWQYARRISFMSIRHPPRGIKTSGVSSRLSRTPAQTLPPARTLVPPVSASPNPGRRHDHCRPQTSIATLQRHFSVPSLAHRAHATSHHHHVRKSPPRRPPVERALVTPWRRPTSREGHRVQRLFENFDGRWTCEWGAQHVRSDTTAKVGPVGAHPPSRGTTRTLAGSVLE